MADDRHGRAAAAAAGGDTGHTETPSARCVAFLAPCEPALPADVAGGRLESCAGRAAAALPQRLPVCWLAPAASVGDVWESETKKACAASALRMHAESRGARMSHVVSRRRRREPCVDSILLHVRTQTLPALQGQAYSRRGQAGAGER